MFAIVLLQINCKENQSCYFTVVLVFSSGNAT